MVQGCSQPRTAGIPIAYLPLCWMIQLHCWSQCHSHIKFGEPSRVACDFLQGWRSGNAPRTAFPEDGFTFRIFTVSDLSKALCCFELLLICTTGAASGKTLRVYTVKISESQSQFLGRSSRVGPQARCTWNIVSWIPENLKQDHFMHRR